MKILIHKIIILVLVGVALFSCSKNEKLLEELPVLEDPIVSEGPGISEGAISGILVVPTGSTIDVNSLTIVSPTDLVSVSNGTYEMNSQKDEFITQLVTDVNEEVLLMGFSYPGQTDFEINSRSTALAMLMNLPTPLLMAPEGKRELIAAILAHPEFTALADQIDALLKQGQSPLNTEQTALVEAIGDVYTSVFNTEASKTKKSDGESSPVEIRRTNNEIIFTNPGKSYDTKIGIYKDGQAIHQITMDRISFVPTGIGDVIGAIASAATGEIPTGLQPAEKSYVLEGEGEFEIKVRNGFYTNGLDSDNVAAWISNMTGWSIDVLVEIIPLGDCVQPLISDFKEFAQTVLTFQEAPAPGEVLGLIYNLISEFLNDSVIVAGCFLNPTENDAYLKALGKLTNFTGMVGLFGNAGNTMVGVYQWFTDNGALDTCYTVKEAVTSECEGNDVYVVGVSRSETGVGVATVWKNGIATLLTDGTYDSQANSVYISGTDLYVVGYQGIEGFNSRIATVWKNGTAISLTDGNSPANATSVYVDGTDVYVVGTNTKANSNTTLATVWKNGIETFLTDTPSSASAVYVFESDVYVAGRETRAGMKSIATVWKNGEATSLTDGSITTSLSSIYITNNDIYVAGAEIPFNDSRSEAIIWKNGIKTPLAEGSTSSVSSLYIDGNDVYAAGSISNVGATIWKNGVPTALDDSFSACSAVYVSDNDVYATGYTRNENGNLVATVWTNNVPTLLRDGSTYSRAIAIFVKESNVPNNTSKHKK